MQIINQIPSPNAIFDISWSEQNPDLLVGACGDGNIRLFKMGQNQAIGQQPVHQKEVNSVECNHMITNYVLTSSLDGTIKITDIDAMKHLLAFPAHNGPAYQTVWHPRNGDLIASAGGDGFLKLWNIKTQKPVFSIPAHNQEILSLDFNKYTDMIATGSSDNLIRIWDLKMPKQPVMNCAAHRYAVKKVKFSPHHPNFLISGSQ